MRIMIRVAAIVIAAHVVLQPIAAVAASGWREDSRCCCPDLTECHCPHGDAGNGAAMLRPCGNAGVMVAPCAFDLVVPAVVPVLISPRPIVIAPAPERPPPAERWSDVVTPPF